MDQQSTAAYILYTEPGKKTKRNVSNPEKKMMKLTTMGRRRIVSIAQDEDHVVAPPGKPQTNTHTHGRPIHTDNVHYGGLYRYYR